MKFSALFLLLTFSYPIIAQEIPLELEANYISQFGLESDLVSFVPLFKLSKNQINNQEQSADIKQLPKGIKTENTAYGFLYFTGLKHSSFPREICFLIEGYQDSVATIYLDRNGNLDFSDDGKAISYKNKETFSLANENHQKAILYYEIGRSQISPNNESALKSRYQSKYPKSEIIGPRFWLTAKRLNLRLSQNSLEGKAISILLLDNSADGCFRMETHSQGDRILILEGTFQGNQDFSSLLRQAQVLDPNAVFSLYSQAYYLKSFSPDGRQISLAKTSTKPEPVFIEGEDISDFSIQLLDGSSANVGSFLKDGKPLIIDVGGTWCGGCLKQEPEIKKIYASTKVEVIGVFEHDNQQSVEVYRKSHDLPWTLALADAKFRKHFNITLFPSYILVSPEGKIISVVNNARDIYSSLSL
ncbi:TlpA family protein disulfide reductase [Croceimicrobium hydrocarbonivorans]|uniref:TlpA family protein disulfide reductase n=1 Tax=Croceimicrobium hydrocarbonivorans TaxID=2761580 RepID=A0A7H0VBI9_9FLAO|nr:TlpA disulfide reductase family protein [Croceimicrobium hydrocarbonivorans]QNR23087.1 TlpA family protein disulfide reductase [Croceimicrobium hydrocarbonivorans]